MEHSPFDVLILITLFIVMLFIPLVIKKRIRRWFFGGKVKRTFSRKIKSNRRFYISDVDIHVIDTRRHQLVGIELQQRTAVGKHPVLMTFTLQEANEFHQALGEALGFATGST